MIPLQSEITFNNPGIVSLAQKIVDAKLKGRKIIVMLGGAVIKEGCSLLLIDLIKKGFISHIAGNGAVSIHDFEIAMIGETSENVRDGLRDGSFGMVEETGHLMNIALNKGASENMGYGLSIANKIKEENFPHKNLSVLYNALQAGIPATIHIAIGGDIIHQHPLCDGSVLGKTSFHDFKVLTESVSQLKDGVMLNIGSAVNLPEVFLKALTIARNLGYNVENFTTANFDFFDMYRPRTRIIEWPKEIGCTGFDIRGGHTETIPALHAAIMKLAGLK